MEPGTRLGAYEIEALLGAGGMGQVFRARDTRLGRTVALKILPANRATDPDHRRRLLQEARAASALNHPNIVTLYDIARDGEVDFLVMEYVAGKSLDAAIDRGLSIDQTVRFASQIAQALTAAHAAGIVHRDIKPANILITDDEQVKVLDFGLAKLAETDASHSLQTTVVGPVTRPGMVMGTIAYMSPEQARGEPIDARTDLFALGAVLFEMSTGRQAFTRAFDWTQPSVQGLDARLRPMVTKLLEADRNRRYQTIADVVADLRPLLREGDSTDTPRPAFRTGWLPRRAAVVATAAVVLLLIAVVGLLSRRTETPSSIATNAPATDRRLSTGGPASTNREANEAFELAMNFQGVQNDIPRAQEMLERALASDPQFAEALRYHATNSVILLLNGYSNDTSQLYRAEDEIRQASKIDPNLPGLPSAWATVYLTQGRKELVPWQQLDDALRADPAHVNNRFWRGLALWLAGRPESAQQDFRTILEQQPLFGPARMFLAESIREQGDVRTAIVELEKVLQQAPDNISAIQWLTMAYLDTGDWNRARQLLEDKRRRFSENYLWRAAWALVLAVGRRDEAQRALDDETLKFAAAAFPSTLVVAEFYAVVGDRTRAIEWLERAVRNGDERTQLFRNSRRLASLREDPRFGQIIDSIEARRKASLQ